MGHNVCMTLLPLCLRASSPEDTPCNHGTMYLTTHQVQEHDFGTSDHKNDKGNSWVVAVSNR
eukprot:12527062-Heterocapsa_arctica.AAC.1